MHPLNRLQIPWTYAIVGLAWILAFAGATPTRAVEDDMAEPSSIFLKWSTGFDFSRGDYGLSEDTTLYYVPLSVTVDYERFRTRLSIPFLVSSGPTRIAGGGVVIDSDEERGLGQLEVAGSYLFDPIADGLPYLELSSRVIAPTETSTALGTGLWGVAIQADLFQRFGPITPYLSAGRKFYIECGCRDRLTHRFYASVGASYAVTETVSLGFAYDWLEAATEAASDSHELVPYASLRLNRSWSIGPYAVIGFSDGSPDYGFGFSLSIRP